MRPPPQPNSNLAALEHETLWDEPLLDWLDGMADATQATLVERHVRECAACRQRLLRFRELDRELRAAVAKPTLAADFDRKLLDHLKTTGEMRRDDLDGAMALQASAIAAALSQPQGNPLLWVMPGMLTAVAWLQFLHAAGAELQQVELGSHILLLALGGIVVGALFGRRHSRTG